ncbi:hypothetical protein G6030_01380 [Dietzia sp. E1]|uniref:hypothetical protein n=1 Tax=Dietzia sp. E1 TaxID=328361 RepID=UPI0015FB603E|nr:hypothetical protein [Dietzia sp. E1]MBB1019967.1 hypothetical protein [Dietzia sp. E1]
MLSGPLHQLHTTIDGSVDGLTVSLPAGPIGNLVAGVLNIPGVIVATIEFIVLGFGS